MRSFVRIAVFVAFALPATGHCFDTWARASGGGQAILSKDGMLVAAGNSVIKLFDASTGEYIRMLCSFHRTVRTIQFDRSASLLLASNLDETKLVRVSDGVPIWTLDHPFQSPQAYLSPNGDAVLVRHYSGVGQCIEVPTGTVRFGFDAFPGPFTSSGDSFVAFPGGSAVVLYDASTGNQVRNLSPLPSVGQQLRQLEFSSDDTKLGCAVEQGVLIWDLTTSSPVRQVGPLYPNRFAFVDGANRIATGAPDWEGFIAKVVNISSSEVDRTIPTNGYVLSLSANGDGSKLLTAATGQNILTWDAASWAYLRSFCFDLFGFHPTLERPIAISPDGEIVVVGGQALSAYEVRSQRLLFQDVPVSGQEYEFLSFSPDSMRLAAGQLGRVRIFDTRTWKQLYELSAPPGTEGEFGGNLCASFSPSGRLVAIGGGYLNFGKGGTFKHGCSVRLFTTADGALVETLTGFSGLVTATFFSMDEQFVYGVGENIRKWRIEDSSLQVDVPTDFRSVTVRTEPNVLIAGHSGSRILLVNPDTNFSRSVAPSGEESILAFSHDGKKLFEMLYLSEQNLNRPEIIVHRVSNLKVLGSFATEVGAGVVSISFASNGHQMAMSRQDPAFVVMPTPPVLK